MNDLNLIIICCACYFSNKLHTGLNQDWNFHYIVLFCFILNSVINFIYLSLKVRYRCCGQFFEKTKLPPKCVKNVFSEFFHRFQQFVYDSIRLKFLRSWRTIKNCNWQVFRRFGQAREICIQKKNSFYIHVLPKIKHIMIPK